MSKTTKKELEKRIADLESRVAALHAVIATQRAYTPYPSQPYPSTWPTITCSTAPSSTSNPAKITLRVAGQEYAGLIQEN